MRRGFLVALEGMDGAGTTSQLAPLCAALTADGHAVLSTHEPSARQTGRLARSYLATAKAPAAGAAAAAADRAGEAAMALLFAADRLVHVDSDLAPALAAGQVVLCDRYLWSSYVYQTTGAPPAALPLTWVQQINAQAPAAHLTLWFDLPVATAAERRRGRGGSAERYEDHARQTRVAAAYRALYAAARAANAAPVVRIDAAAPLPEVTQACLAALRTALQMHAALKDPAEDAWAQRLDGPPCRS